MSRAPEGAAGAAGAAGAGALPPEPDGEALVYVAERLLGTAREELARADTKASVLLSGALAVPALLFGGRWAPGQARGAWLVVLVAGGALWLAGSGLLVWAILPRTGTARAGPALTYFADARALDGPQALRAALREAGRDKVAWLTTQFVDTSTILSAKYRCLRRGMACLAPGLALCLTALAATA
jgi:hypothetical protein